MKDFGAVMRGLGATALEAVFGAEYVSLSDQKAKLVLQDFLEASEEDKITAREYKRRIGDGNLDSYADCLVARFEQGRW